MSFSSFFLIPHPLFFLSTRSHSTFVQFTAFSPLGTRDSRPHLPVLLEDETLGAIAKKYNKEPANIALRWNLQSGVSAIPKVREDAATSTPTHMRLMNRRNIRTFLHRA